MTGRKGLALIGTDVERKNERMNGVPTMSCLDPLFHGYPRSGLAKYEEQTEADPNSFVFVPNRICSDHENGLHRDKLNEMVGSFTGRTYLPQRPAPQMRALESE